MRSEVRGILSVMMSGLLLGGPLVGMSQAVDGTKLITQNNALAGNVTPGDAPGFPVTISQPGSYRLASNLTVPDENTTAIEITAENVTLDLNGFTIQGPTVCGGLPLVCAPTGSGRGVSGGRRGITLVNGTVEGMGNRGVLLGAEARVEQVRAVSNGENGISAGEDSVVTGNIASRNGGTGMNAANSTVSGNTASRNGGGGISAIACTVTENIVENNGGTGIFATLGSTVMGNMAFHNGILGISTAAETGYNHNVSSNNTGPAIGGTGVSLGQNLCDGVVC